MVVGPGTESPLTVSGLHRARQAAASARRTGAIIARLRRLEAPREADLAAIAHELGKIIRRLDEGHPVG